MLFYLLSEYSIHHTRLRDSPSGFVECNVRAKLQDIADITNLNTTTMKILHSPGFIINKPPRLDIVEKSWLSWPLLSDIPWCMYAHVYTYTHECYTTTYYTFTWSWRCCNFSHVRTWTPGHIYQINFFTLLLINVEIERENNFFWYGRIKKTQFLCTGYQRTLWYRYLRKCRLRLLWMVMRTSSMYMRRNGNDIDANIEHLTCIQSRSL